jgi:hypothetical protein
MKKQLKEVIQICKNYKVETSICGQAGSNKEMAEFLVKQGIDSISVNADKAEEISRIVHELEAKGLKSLQSEDFDMARKAKIEKIDDLECVEKKGKDIQKEVRKENKEKAGEMKKIKDNIKIEEKIESKAAEDSKKEESIEYPDVDIGFNIFEEQGVLSEKEPKHTDLKKSEKKDDDSEILLNIF